MGEASLSALGLTYEQELEHQLSMIRHFALEHKLPPFLVGSYFSAGLAAARVLDVSAPAVEPVREEAA